ncbi:MAG: hypothetical protein H0W70_00510 [Actinobacteria bacterium]|nr:hypothetical protein [Actinomycetota bacterium]
MSRARIERRLDDVTVRLRRARAELAVVDEQLAVLADHADDAALRALVSETPLAEREHRDARRHSDALARSRAAVMTSITELERAQDDLLGRLVPGQ